MSIYLFGTSAYTLLIGRVAMALIFLVSGWEKITGYAATQQYMEAMGGLPSLLPLAILIEIAGGLAIFLGAMTSWTSIGLAAYTFVAGLLYHGNIHAQSEHLHLLKNIAMAGGFLILSVHGPGQISVDYFVKRRRGRFPPA